MTGTISALAAWMGGHQGFVQCMGIISLVTFLITPLLISLLVVRIPDDYFLHGRDHFHEMSRNYHPVIRVLFRVAKNGAGTVFLVAGIAMLVLPGQGVVTILVGLSLIDFPGKRALELWLVRKKKVLSTVNWIRTKAGRPELKVPR
jgi:hypothetical protein